MLDFGFGEMAVVFVVALLVLGPERLPKTAHQVGKWLGQARRTWKKMQDEFLEQDAAATLPEKPLATNSENITQKPPHE